MRSAARHPRQQRRLQQHAKALEDITDEHLMMTLETNIGGYFHMARAALPHMGQGACIVNNEFGNRAVRQQAAARLLGDEGRDQCVHDVTREQPARSRDSGQRGGAGPGLDAAQTRPTRTRNRWRNSARTATCAALHSRRRCHRPTSFLASPVTGSYVNGAILPVMGGLAADEDLSMRSCAAATDRRRRVSALRPRHAAPVALVDALREPGGREPTRDLRARQPDLRQSRARQGCPAARSAIAKTSRYRSVFSKSSVRAFSSAPWIAASSKPSSCDSARTATSVRLASSPS